MALPDGQVLLAEKVELRPTRAQEEVLWALSDKSRRLYNQALEGANRYYEKNSRYIGVHKLRGWLTEHKRKHPEFRYLYSKAAQMVVRRLDSNFRSFFALRRSGDGKARPPGFRSRRYFFCLEYNQSGFEVDDTKIALHFNKGEDVNLRYSSRPEFRIDGKRIKAVQVYQDRVSKAFRASIVYQADKPKPANDKTIAFDPGVKTLLTGFDGKRIVKYSSHPIASRMKYFGKQLDRVQSKIDTKEKGSKNKKKLVRVKHKLLRRRDAQVNQILHSYANHIAKRHGRVLVGNWDKEQTISRDPKKGRGNRRINRAVKGLPVMRLVGYLAYKGARVEKVDERETTRRCCNCGYARRKSVLPTERILMCPKCGIVIDRDANAAMNIYSRHLAPVTGPPPFSGRKRMGCRPWTYAFSRHAILQGPREILASFPKGSPPL